METKKKVEALRHEIDTIDREIVRLLDRRAEVGSVLGKVKLEGRMHSYDPTREGEILERLRTRSQGIFPRSAIDSVFREIISACRALQAPLSVSYLGPPGSYCQLACLRQFGRSIWSVPKERIQDMFRSVETAEVTFGVVPIENSNEGAVSLTSDLLMESEAKVCGEILLRVSHALLSKKWRLGEIRKVYSHPQALGQCRGWLSKNLSSARLVETSSTAKAAQLAAREEGTGAIASPLAAGIYGLRPLASEIEDYRNNFTRFFILGREDVARTGKDKTSLVFSIPHKPGFLSKALSPFAERKINLTRIESRPLKNNPWQYFFFVDLEGHETDSKVQRAVRELEKRAQWVRLLGSYPRGHCFEEKGIPMKKAPVEDHR